ncbi:tripartite tricarboxylate transporter family receptor domain-containing protein [Ditylenchus destructor]|uniref:Citrate synthase n=1 Tax=Ditylenchus destructor TaxID=166010 RepID=A0AAD4QR15_9BILA|nr:tripartite tricarboxylate transporter family receptor domain-containing protein [Ditylenchus destructor]
MTIKKTPPLWLPAADALELMQRIAARARGRRSVETVASEAIQWASRCCHPRYRQWQMDGCCIADRTPANSQRMPRWKTWRGCCGKARRRASTPPPRLPMRRTRMNTPCRPDCSRWQRAPVRTCPRAAARQGVAGRGGSGDRALADAMLRTAPPRADTPMHMRLAAAWRRPRAADDLRRALVLLADHELNASTFAARVTASTGASMAACLLTGLSTLTGPLHGGASAAVQALVRKRGRRRHRSRRARMALARTAAGGVRASALSGGRCTLRCPAGEHRAAARIRAAARDRREAVGRGREHRLRACRARSRAQAAGRRSAHALRARAQRGMDRARARTAGRGPFDTPPRALYGPAARHGASGTGRNVVGLSAGDELAVDDDLLVAPLRARVLQVGLQRGPRGHLVALDAAGVDQRPWAVADRRDGLAGLDECTHEGDRLLVDAQRVGVHDAARQQQRVEVVGPGALERHVDREAVGRIVMVPAAHAALGGRDDPRPRAGVVERLARLGHLDLLEAVGHEDGDLQSIERRGRCRGGRCSGRCSGRWGGIGHGWNLLLKLHPRSAPCSPHRPSPAPPVGQFDGRQSSLRRVGLRATCRSLSRPARQGFERPPHAPPRNCSPSRRLPPRPSVHTPRISRGQDRDAGGAIRRRRPHRPCRSRPGRSHAEDAGHHHRGGQHRRRGQFHRHRQGGTCQSRRLHAAAEPHRHVDDAGALSQAALQRRDRLRIPGMVNEVPMTLIGKPGLPANNYKELTTWISANKGKINLGNAGLGAASHLCGLLFQSALKVEMTPVPYKGTAPAIADLLGGQIDLLCDQTTNTTSQIEAKKGQGLRRDHEQAPDHARAEGPAHAGRGTPAPVLKKLNDAIKAAMKDPGFIQREEALGAVITTDKRTEPAEHKKFVSSEIAKWGPIIKAAGVYAD